VSFALSLAFTFTGGATTTTSAGLFCEPPLGAWNFLPSLPLSVFLCYFFS